ncbi:hypothetical protein [Methylobacterium sp. Leaf91]|uniref:DUF6932 family protein n=1 Tax=Methylobacterium sp. Leaf91 TaxID=1736247 RepID=UPI0012E85747|nr:hypothetical protein [Methylobacterium sp. Leaf91]
MAGTKRDFHPLLAPGRHETWLFQVHWLCVLPFDKSTVREELFQKFCRFVQAFVDLGINCTMLINGSFRTDEPNNLDVDVAVVLDQDVAESLNAEQEELINLINDNNFIDKIDGFVETEFPIGHPFFRANGNEVLWSEQYGREHLGAWLKGIAVLRIGETDVGLRIRR